MGGSQPGDDAGKWQFLVASVSSARVTAVNRYGKGEVTCLVALGGLIFGCGLSGWAIVRWVFNFIDKNSDAGIDEVAKNVKGVL